MSTDFAPRFSIVVPLYNKAAYVRSTLESVLAQTFRDFEVVVVDNGSTDGGGRIVEEFAARDSRVRLLWQANAGVSVARNRGIDAARGEWIAFLDADDWQHPEYLACLAGVQQAQPRAEAVATRFVEFEDTGGAPPPWQVPVHSPVIEWIADLPARWMRGPSIFTGSLAVRRELLLAMQPCFAPGESWGEDLDLFFRLAERTPIALAHVPLVAYRKGVSGSLATKVPSQLPPWVDRLVARVRSGETPAALRDSSMGLVGEFQVDMARRAFAEGRRVDGMRWLRCSAFVAARTRRWWTTAAMALLPSPVVHAALARIKARATGCAPATADPAPAWQPVLDSGQPAAAK